MAEPFIRDEHVGFICVHFTDTNEFTRWGVSRDWKDAGECTLGKVKALLDSDPFAAGGRTIQDGILNLLAELVVEAAMEADLDVLPCRSYALMVAFGSPCLVLEATRADAGVRGIRALPVFSAAQADEMIDAMAADLGLGTARPGCDRQGNIYALIPVSPDDGSLPTGDELASGLPASVAGALGKFLDDPEVRAQLLAAMHSHGQGGALRVH